MAVKMDEFLLEYYRRLIFRSMPIEQLVQFGDYVKRKDYAGNMKDWAENLLKLDAAGNPIEITKGVYERKDLPNPEMAVPGDDYELSPDEWKNFFKAFQKTFQAMDANKKSFKYNDKANKFLKKYFGTTGQLFTPVKADAAAELKINELNNILNANPGLKQVLGSYFNDDFSWNDLIDGIRDKKYNSDPKFQKHLQDIAAALDYDTKYNTNSPVLKMVGHTLDFKAIADGFSAQDPSPAKILQFQSEYSDLLKELYTNSKAYEVFQANDSSKISKMLEEAKSRVDYNNKESDGYVPPKRADELSLGQRISDYWDNTYSNYLEKYVKLQGDRMFFSPQAKSIFKEIDKLNIKPTDGIDKILENASKISEKLKTKSNAAYKQFDWFNKTMGDLKNTMPKAFAGALKNGRQMHAIIEELIIKAVREDKVAEAKTAMELLSVIKYGYTTSKIMNTLGKEQFTVFSDGGLSWNKNEGVKFVTTAMDKSIKAAFMGVGYMITVAGNAIRLSGSKFNGVRGRIKTHQENKLAEFDAARTKVETSQHTLKSQKAVEEARKIGLAAPGIGLTDATIAGETAALATENQRLMTELQNIEQLRSQIDQLQEKVKELDDDIKYLEDWLNDPANATSPDYAAIADQHQKLNAQKSPITSAITTLQGRLTTAENAYNPARSAADTRGQQITEFNEASQSIAELDSAITTHQKELQEWDDKHQDKYKELMAYWDFLETGRNNHMGKMYTWFGSKDKRQKKFDQKEDLRDSLGRVIIDPATGRPKQDLHKNILFNQYLNDYDIAA